MSVRSLLLYLRELELSCEDAVGVLSETHVRADFQIVTCDIRGTYFPPQQLEAICSGGA